MFSIFNIFKDSCKENKTDDDDDDNVLNANQLIEAQKSLTEPIYDINNQTDIYVQIFDNVLLPEECERIIKLFNKHSKHQYKGIVLGDQDNSLKNTRKPKHTQELNITDVAKENKDFSEIDKLLYNRLQTYLNTYITKIKEKVRTSNIKNENENNIIDTGYQIQKYKKNTGYYVNHVDSHVFNTNIGIHDRIITYIWYLNDINEGGETNFISNFKIKPVAGRLLFFPSTWSYPHAGLIPISSDKYIITGWIYQITTHPKQ